MWDDIEKEVKTAWRNKCKKCSKGHATVWCTYRTCRHVYHVACAIESKVHFQFTDAHPSFCNKHKQIDDSNERIHKSDDRCYICQFELGEYDPITSVPSCCDNGWYHSSCVKKAALKSGYLLHCPTCGLDKDGYRHKVALRGIYTPNVDAAWELTHNAFQSLLYQYKQCDADECLCKKGRTYHEEDGDWEIMVCDTCGSKGVHIKCFKSDQDIYVCTDCHIMSQTQNKSHEVSSIESSSESSSMSEQKQNDSLGTSSAEASNESNSTDEQVQDDSSEEMFWMLTDTKRTDIKRKTLILLRRNEALFHDPLNSDVRRQFWIERTKSFFESMEYVNGCYFPRNKLRFDVDEPIEEIRHPKRSTNTRKRRNDEIEKDNGNADKSEERGSPKKQM